MEQKSSIIAIGLSVHHTPVDIREKLSIPEVGSARKPPPWHTPGQQSTPILGADPCGLAAG